MNDEKRDELPATESYVVRLRGRGQMTVPRRVREHLAVTEGDVVRLVRVGDAYVLTPRDLRVPELADRIANLMSREGVTLADLLAGLEDERQRIEADRSTHA